MTIIIIHNHFITDANDLRCRRALKPEIYIHNNMGGSPGDVTEEPLTYEKRKKVWRMSCDEGEVTETENEQSS